MNRDTLVNIVLGILTTGGLGAALRQAFVWLTSSRRRNADIADTVTGTALKVVEAMRADYQRVRTENAQLADRIKALEEREDAKDQALHEFVVWAEQARQAASRHEPPLTLPPPPRSPLETR